MAVGTSIMNQSRVEKHFGVKNKILYQEALVNKGRTVKKKLRTAPASFQLAAASFLHTNIISVPRGVGALNDRLGYQGNVPIENEGENSVILITKCDDIMGRLVMETER